MGAIIEGVDPAPRGRPRRATILAWSVGQVLLGEEAAADARLVGHDHGQEAGLVDLAHGLGRCRDRS